MFNVQIDSHEKTVNKGKQEINQIADRLAMKPREDITMSAHRLYKMRWRKLHERTKDDASRWGVFVRDMQARESTVHVN